MLHAIIGVTPSPIEEHADPQRFHGAFIIGHNRLNFAVGPAIPVSDDFPTNGKLTFATNLERPDDARFFPQRKFLREDDVFMAICDSLDFEIDRFLCVNPMYFYGIFRIKADDIIG
ncbi:MAG: hypothetical protein AAYR33_05905 [Acetobacteraceae bacterium]